MNKNKKNKNGFTLIEIMIVIAIGVILATIVTFSFFAMKERGNINKNISQAKVLLEQAKVQSVSGLNDTNYGVHVQFDKLVLFSGSTYFASSTDNVPLIFENNLFFATSSFAGGDGSNVVFKKITGATDNYGSLTIKTSNSSTSAVIYISPAGAIIQ
ncbi:MAG: type II secretion system protein [bacterium]